ncbi:BppU family phage baseplate upper protein [Listeria seeligeri]|uniref:BppU family phage baseplate upper protein n=1 Tax=Listeria seeligeri TaxID=1640 RepID=UPI001623BCB2|nr:BppU family phage baseplate upper protein [Listeria seeligeri]EFS0527675.1 BppU family phage baseplate upper protein [Listeria monocytogenes]EFU8666364.1 BppU family phage baseplate upper protein [Listeria monocytogenes]MBC1747312.1 BppU family phage baseplate upper protein [Listeria seeligeri]MBF2551587.1 BppU family phage baseplate upper protein [Listeria seeligeri]MBF2604155.1 BppU family phage baseplate upper protein [Listeria seeligeri]
MSNLRKINATLDLNRKSWSIERIEAIQGDINSLTIAARIVLDGKGMNLSDYTPTFAVVLPGTNDYVIDDLHFDTGRLSEGYFEYTFVKEAFSVPGVYDTARFILQKADKTELSGMPRFTYYVEKDPLQGKVVAESYISDFERLEQMIHDVETEIAGLHDEVTSESMRLDTEIAELDAKIDTETSKLQTEANDLQTQFDSFNPSQFAQQTDLNAHVNNADIHVTSADKTIWNAKETTAGAQAKADKALDDAKTDAASLYEPKITKTAWTAPVLNSGFSILDSRFPILYRLKGSTLQIKGAVGRTSAKGAMFNLPAGFRTSERRGFSVSLVTSVGGSVGTVYFQTNGDVELVAASQDSPVWVEVSFDID